MAGRACMRWQAGKHLLYKQAQAQGAHLLQKAADGIRQVHATRSMVPVRAGHFAASRAQRTQNAAARGGAAGVQRAQQRAAPLRASIRCKPDRAETGPALL